MGVLNRIENYYFNYFKDRQINNPIIEILKSITSYYYGKEFKKLPNAYYHILKNDLTSFYFSEMDLIYQNDYASLIHYLSNMGAFYKSFCYRKQEDVNNKFFFVNTLKNLLVDGFFETNMIMTPIIAQLKMVDRPIQMIMFFDFITEENSYKAYDLSLNICKEIKIGSDSLLNAESLNFIILELQNKSPGLNKLIKWALLRSYLILQKTLDANLSDKKNIETLKIFVNELIKINLQEIKEDNLRIGIGDYIKLWKNSKNFNANSLTEIKDKLGSIIDEL